MTACGISFLRRISRANLNGPWKVAYLSCLESCTLVKGLLVVIFFQLC